MRAAKRPPEDRSVEVAKDVGGRKVELAPRISTSPSDPLKAASSSSDDDGSSSSAPSTSSTRPGRSSKSPSAGACADPPGWAPLRTARWAPAEEPPAPASTARPRAPLRAGTMTAPPEVRLAAPEVGRAEGRRSGEGAGRSQKEAPTDSPSAAAAKGIARGPSSRQTRFTAEATALRPAWSRGAS